MRASQGDAKRYETYLKANWQPKGNAAELRAEGDRVLAAGTDPRAAARAYAQAVVFDANDVRRLDRARPRAARHQARPGQRALRAARQCFRRRLDRLRARADAGRQGRRALVVLHEALKRRSYWRPAIDALKASLTLVERRARCARPTTRWWPSTASASSSTRSRPTPPCRACASSSPSAWRPGQVDWSQYFMVDGKDPQAVTAEARQICLDGLAHGKRYEVQVREGLPSAIGEKLAKTAELAVYVKDRAPSVRATGRGYVLPNRGQQGIPLVTVNTDKVKRRGLPHRRPQPGADAAERRLRQADLLLRHRRAQGAHRRPVYAGELAVATRLNEDVTTRLPHRRGHPQAAARRLRAGRLRLDQEGGRRLSPGRHAVVHRLRSRPHRHQRRRRHARLRALARGRHAGGQRQRAPDRPQQRGAGHRQDRQPRLCPLRCRASSAARAGWRRPCWSPRRPTATTPSSISPTGAFDLTDRGVKGRIAPGPDRCLRLYRPRRLPRRRAGAPGRPGARPHRQGVGRSRHRHLLAPRRRRALARDAHRPGPGRPRHDAGARRLGHDRHLARQDPHRPQGRPIAQASFLVEDFVPERLDLKLEPAVQALIPAGARHHQARRPLPLRAARRRPCRRGRDRRASSPRAICRALPATGSASPTSRWPPCASRSKACPPPTPRARPTSPCSCPRCRRPAGRWKPT